MSESVERSLSLYYPDIYARMKYLIPNGFNETVIMLDNGECLIYDNLDESIQKLPSDMNGMSDEEYAEMFGYRLRKIMQRKGISQQELSNKTEITQSTLSLYINGKRIPNLYTVYKLSIALNCSINHFVFELK